MTSKRDPKSKAIINTDAEALNKYKLERSYYRKVDSISSDIAEIKDIIANMCKRIEILEGK